MSETLQPTPEAERPEGPKPPSRIVWFLCGMTVAGMAYFFIEPIISALDGIPHGGTLNVGCAKGMYAALLSYAKDNDGNLPPTLLALVPKYISETGGRPFRYVNDKTREPFDWLYFPHGKLDGLPSDTILLASPGSTSSPSLSPHRLVCKVTGYPEYLADTDFQRLIREQNPPPAK